MQYVSISMWQTILPPGRYISFEHPPKIINEKFHSDLELPVCPWATLFLVFSKRRGCIMYMYNCRALLMMNILEIKAKYMIEMIFKFWLIYCFSCTPPSWIYYTLLDNFYITVSNFPCLTFNLLAWWHLICWLGESHSYRVSQLINLLLS